MIGIRSVDMKTSKTMSMTAIAVGNFEKSTRNSVPSSRGGVVQQVETFRELKSTA